MSFIPPSFSDEVEPHPIVRLLVAGKLLLTPVALAAGRRVSARLFGGEKYKDLKLSYENIPT